MSASPQTIQITVDPRDAVNAISFAFSNSSKAITELLQNANRSNPTRVEVTFVDNVLSVADDGCGIVDFQMLLAYARSGWSESVKKNVHPFGLGLFAALYTCDRIEIESGRTRLASDTKPILDLQPVALETLPDERKGTSVKMIGCRFKDNYLSTPQLGEICAGFPVPVTFNGELLERRYAIDSPGEWHQTKVGLMRTFIGNNRGLRTYLQGFSIGHRSRSDVALVHLDPVLFKGRMPDRDTLIDEDQAHRQIADAHFELQRVLITAALKKAKQEGDKAVRDFVVEHAKACVEFKCIDVLNEVPYLPRAWFWIYSDLPRMSRYSGDEECKRNWFAPDAKGELVCRDELPEKVMVGDFDDSSMVEATYHWASDIVHIDHVEGRELAEGNHWIKQYLVPWDAWSHAEFEVSAENARAVSCDLSVDVMLCDAITINGPNGPVRLPEYGGVFDGEDGEGTMYVTTKTDDNIIGQAYDHQTEFDGFDEAAFDEDVRTLDRAVALAAGRNLGDVLALVLDRIRWDVPQELRGQSYTVTIDKNGDITAALVAE